MSVYERLGVILEKLYRGERLKIAELAKEFGTSTKTIQRDFKEKLPSKFITREGNTFFLKKEALNQEAKEQIFLQVFQNFSKKIGESFESEAKRFQERVLLFPKDKHLLKLNSQILLQAQKAMEKKTFVCLMYQNFLYQEVALQGIYVFHHRLMLCGWYENQERFFDLEKIEYLNLENKKHLFDFAPSVGKYQVVLFVYPNRAKQFKQSVLAYEKKILEDHDGGLIVEFHTQELDSLVGEILSWIPDVVVLEPQELKDEIQKHLQSYIYRCQ